MEFIYFQDLYGHLSHIIILDKSEPYIHKNKGKNKEPFSWGTRLTYLQLSNAWEGKQGFHDLQKPKNVWIPVNLSGRLLQKGWGSHQEGIPLRSHWVATLNGENLEHSYPILPSRMGRGRGGPPNTIEIFASMYLQIHD